MSLRGPQVQAAWDEYAPEGSETTSVYEGRVENLCRRLDAGGVSRADVVMSAMVESWARAGLHLWMQDPDGPASGNNLQVWGARRYNGRAFLEGRRPKRRRRCSRS